MLSFGRAQLVPGYLVVCVGNHVTPNRSIQPDPYFAAIDLGSNSCRLLVCAPATQGLKVVEAYSRVVRLSEGVSLTGLMTDDAMDRVMVVLEQSAKKLKRFSPCYLDCVATEACRSAQNTSAFLERIKQKTQFDFRVISQEEEARLTVKGIASLLDPSYPYALVFDVGGGSTEVVFLRQRSNQPPEVIDWMSLPIGVVSITEIEKPNCATSYLRVVSSLKKALLKFGAPHTIKDLISRDQIQLIGSSGTATTAAALHLDLHYYDRQRIDGQVLTFAEVERVIKRIQMMSPHERVQHPCIGPERADLVLGGMAIFEGLAKAWPIGRVTVADRGVRDGLIQKMYQDYLKKIPPNPGKIK